MESGPLRQASSLSVGACTLLPILFVACSDSNGPITPPPTFDIGPVAASLSGVTQTLIELAEAQKALADLAALIAPVMGPGGFPPSIAERLPEVVVDRAPGVESEPRQASVLSMRTLRNPALAQIPLPSFLLIPFGKTCIWVVSKDGWGVGPDTFGQPPSDGTFFELYETNGPRQVALDATGATIPLDGDAFTSVRPMSQGSVLDVEWLAKQSGQTVLDARTQGTVSEPDIFDVSIRDGMLAAGTTVLDFDIDLTPTALQTGGSVLDVRLDETLTLGPSGFTLILEVRKTGVGAQTIIYALQLGLQDLSITSGSVTIDQVNVATVSGFPDAPIFTVTDERFPSSQRVLLGDIFDDGEDLSGALLDVLLFGACVGADAAAVDLGLGESTFCDLLP